MHKNSCYHFVPFHTANDTSVMLIMKLRFERELSPVHMLECFNYVAPGGTIVYVGLFKF